MSKIFQLYRRTIFLQTHKIKKWPFILWLTIEPLTSSQSRDSISTVAPPCPMALFNGTEWHHTVEIESCDCQEMRGSSVQSLPFRFSYPYRSSMESYDEYEWFLMFFLFTSQPFKVKLETLSSFKNIRLIRFSFKFNVDLNWNTVLYH